MDYTPGGYNMPPENNNFNNNRYQIPVFRTQPPFVPHEVWYRERNYLRRLSFTAAGSILLYIVLSTVVSGLLVFLARSPALNEGNYGEFIYLFDIFYSIFLVGGPFFLLGFLTRKPEGGQIPMGKPKNAKYLPIIVLGAFGVCLIGDIVTSQFDAFIEALTGFELEMPEMPEMPHTVYGVFISLLGTAIVPALVEEMALRGVIMQSLRRYGDWFAIVCSALVFGLLHCNLVQIPFAIIAGIAIGYAVVVTESLWTGILIHFCNNAFSVAVTTVADFKGYDSPEYAACNIAFYALMAVGCVCVFIWFKWLNKTKMKKSPLINEGRGFFGSPHPFSARISSGKLYRTYFLNPAMIIALIAIAYETALALYQ